MLYPILVEYYVWFSSALLCITWCAHQHKLKTRTNLMCVYSIFCLVGFFLALHWMAGVVFGLIVLEIGRLFKMWVDKKAQQLNK